jgi:hypothetical protein
LKIEFYANSTIENQPENTKNTPPSLTFKPPQAGEWLFAVFFSVFWLYFNGIYPLKTNHKMRKQLTFFTLILIGYPASRVQR